MTALIITMIVLGSVVVYCILGGAVGMAFYRNRMNSCPRCISARAAHASGDYYFNSCNEDHNMSAGFAGVFWWAIIPILIGVYVGDHSERQSKKIDNLQTEIKRLEAENNIGAT